MRGRWARLVRADDDRIRLGWRILMFVVFTIATATLVAPFLPSGIVGGAAAVLCGSLLAGWGLLAMEGRRPAALGFHLSPRAAGEVGSGLALGAVAGLAVVALMAALGVLRWAPESGDVAGWLLGGAGALAFLALPAAAEEAFLRGYPLQALAEAWGREPAVVVTAGAFGLLHLGNPGVGVIPTLTVIAAGLLLGVVYIRTASLWWATGVHLGWNWSHGYVADVPVSGLEVVDAPLYEGITSGPSWLGGGAFGPEGSVVSTLVLLGAAAACWWGPWLNPMVEANEKDIG